MKNMLAAAMLICATWIVMAGEAAGEATTERKAVLVTGATSGIGRLAAERLADAGFHVYAGARKDSDMRELDALDNISAIRLDVTRQDQFDAAVERIRREGRGLFGLVNNAGINVIEPLIEADLDNLEFLFDGNVYGVFRVTKAFAPLIIETQGRIVNVSSISGILSGGLDGYGMYSMSKHAVEAYTDQLAWEMRHFGVHVSGIEPGNFASNIGVSRCRRLLAEEPKQYRYFEAMMTDYREYCKERIRPDQQSSAPPPEPVAEAIVHALSNEAPKQHYLVVEDPFEGMITTGKLFEEIVHLNHDHKYSYDRDELVQQLDEELAILRGEKKRSWQPD